MRAAAVAMLFAMLGCAPPPQTAAAPAPEADPAAEQPPRDDATLEIDNRGLVDITVYVSHDGLKERLGRSVAAHRDSMFIAKRIVGLANPIRLVAETAGTRGGIQGALTTETIALRPGMRIVWTIESELQRSHLGIY